MHVKDWRELCSLNVEEGESVRLIERLETRVRGLHPVLKDARFAHRWGGPILIAHDWTPVFARHPQSASAIVLGPLRPAPATGAPSGVASALPVPEYVSITPVSRWSRRSR